MDSVYEVSLISNPVAGIDTITPVEWSLPRIVFPEVHPHRTLFQPNIELFNIPFIIRHGDEYVFIESSQWSSLRSHGKNAREAISNMLEMIRELVNEYVFVDESDLTEDAIEFRNFLIQALLV